ncbi:MULTISPECIES: zinc-binding dehydrogenase [Clostridium]|jgi:Threonine dehydrogenase and related Zn-dependent dehydrogenases|uniref:Zinc-binding dehydrogenase n=3 Tax=Clostridium TaxID=1485 RepID=A0AAE2UUL0_CLOBE|nr:MULTISPECIES: zinc-binding dehydrogenase [Clostridium]ABR32413.1 Alcohol dehydrogenase GroES domain protein [Clostridium beijerinckii NCIMB 8052]AIU01725.1 alcohol dehydrogenase [Clostridium beijerinckii ATCC 35702]AVK49273.1 sorbitol dehydrogenase [Clostridium sp. MF28]MBE6087598.1 sorbitol dehydrogenase [Clostridium beijerinckii]MBF7807909.1 zinc-binding dehydrogenase [Clostridium beijerinckii]
MKALTKTNPGYDQMELLDMQEPKATKNFVKIKVEYSGICGSDLHSFKGEYGNIKTPVVLGHEFSGTVVEVGEEVKEIKIGDRVTSETTFETCGTCDYCKSKDYNLCPSRKGIGTQVNGSFAEYVLSREESVHVLPDNVSFLAASLTEPLACCVHAALEKTTIDKDDVVLILGPGPIGLLLAQVVKSQGAKVILSGVTKDKERLEFGKKLGVDVIVDSLQEDLEKIVMEKTNGYGVNRAFDCSGAVPAVNQGLRLIKKKGEFVQVGLFANIKNPLDQEAIIQREIKYVGSRSQKPSSWIKSLELMEAKKVDPEALITKIVDLKDWRSGIEAAMEGTELKVVIRS